MDREDCRINTNITQSCYVASSAPLYPGAGSGRGERIGGNGKLFPKTSFNIIRFHHYSHSGSPLWFCGYSSVGFLIVEEKVHH